MAGLKKLTGAILIPPVVVKDVKREASSVSDFKDKIERSLHKKTSELVEIILAGSFFLEASDVHMEPEEKRVKFRLRIDGVLHDVMYLDLQTYQNIVGRVKLLSKLKLNITTRPQDGRYSILIEGTSIEVRTSTIPAEYGEALVLRILNPKWVVNMEGLGLRPDLMKLFEKEIEKPNGMIICTGPTGSGKTTTLYSILEHLNKPEVKIITVEDPIEYQMEGILQTPVNEQGGYTFVTALRQLLRQNPDIMMIGEIRDNETAVAAVQAALTGHLVLSTIHTNNAAGAVARMINMGVAPQDIATAVNAFIAQRLVRRLCDCKTKTKPTAEEKTKIEKILKTISPASGVKIPPIGYIYKPKGCDKCNHIGYKGRMTVSEVFQMTRNIQDMVSRGAMTAELAEKAIENGMLTMEQDGVIRVLEGETTLEEVERVTDL